MHEEDANVLEVLIGQMGERSSTNPLGKALSVLSETELLQPNQRPAASGSAPGGVLRLRLDCGGTRRCCRGRAAKLADGGKHYPPMPEQYADVLKVLIGQVAERRGTNSVFSKALRVLGHAELFEPVRNLLHRSVAHDANSLSKALASFRSSVSKPSVNQP
jgi:hypothetical protein